LQYKLNQPSYNEELPEIKQKAIVPDHENLHIQTFKAPLGTVKARKPTKAGYHLYLINNKVQSINNSKHPTWKYEHINS
jgi:hypothetical protein